jgi:aryl-alcohol dehydrogenase-like predicted oxidoreductase
MDPRVRAEDAAYAAGVSYVDAARSYGRAEEFLGGWLAGRGYPDVIIGSKWGYRYTGGWRLDAEQQEVKEHSLAMFTAQLAQSRALLGEHLALYQVHSVTADSGLFTDAPLLTALARLRAEGVIIGVTTSGPGQAETVRRVLRLVRNAEFKRKQAAPVLKVTSRAFGTGWRMPIARGE